MAENTSVKQMDINLDGIGHILSDKRLFVPIYQRSYAWEEKHVMDLFMDIEKAIEGNEKGYFLGSIVVITRETSEKLNVVDGQQRLATVSILIAAIRDYLFDKQKDLADDICHGFLMKKDRRTREDNPNLVLNESDNDYFIKTILSNPDKREEIDAIKESHKKIKKAAELASKFVRKLTNKSINPIDYLNDWLDYLEKNLKVILVTVADDANAFMIFETLNDRGLELAISDLLKNYLFGISRERIEEIRQRWLAMFGAFEAIDSEDMVVTYIRHLWSSKKGLIREKELYASIKSEILNKRQAVEFTDELSKNSRLYAAILNPDHEFWVSYGATTRQHMSTLNTLRMIQIRPLLLAILSEFPEEEVKKSFKIMVSWAVRFLIHGGLGGGYLETNYCDRAKEIHDKSIKNTSKLIHAMKGVVPSDSEFKTSFSTISVSKSYLARYYLRALEKIKLGQENPELVPNPNEEEITLEHILPQNPSQKWNYIDSESAKAYCYRLGNLALLSQSINTTAGNDSYTDKLPCYIDSKFNLTQELQKYSSWDIEQIVKRQEELSELAIKAWPDKL